MTEYEQEMLNLTREILENTTRSRCPELQKIAIMDDVVSAARDLRSILSTSELPYFVKQTLAKMYGALDRLPVEKPPAEIRNFATDRPTKTKTKSA